MSNELATMRMEPYQRIYNHLEETFRYMVQGTPDEAAAYRNALAAIWNSALDHGSKMEKQYER